MLKTLSVGRSPSGLALSRDGAILYCANRSGRTVTSTQVASGATVRLLENIDAGDVALTPDETHLYVLADGELVILNLQDNSSVQIDVESAGARLTVSPDGSRVYAVSLRMTATMEGWVTAVNTADLSTKNIGLGDGSSGLTMSSDGSAVFASNPQNGMIAVIDAATEQIFDAIFVTPPGPTALALSRDDRRLYAHAVAGIAVIDIVDI